MTLKEMAFLRYFTEFEGPRDAHGMNSWCRPAIARGRHS